MKKILITGGTGFVGYHLTEALLQQKKTGVELEIYVTSLDGGENFAWYEAIGGQEHIVQVDLTKAEDVKRALKEVMPDEIYHLASIAQVGSSFGQARGVLENNFGLQLNLLEAMSEICPMARILAVSSGAIYDVTQSPTTEIREDCVIGPSNPYAASKAIQDIMTYAYSQSQKLTTVRVRPFNHIGDHQGTGFAVPDFAKQIAEAKKSGGGEMVVGNLKPKRDFTDVKDVVEAYILLMEKGKSGEVYNVGSGVSHSMEEILAKMIEFSGVKVEVKVDEKLIRPVEVMDIIADNSKLRALGWEPKIPLKETLKRVLEYWENSVK